MVVEHRKGSEGSTEGLHAVIIPLPAQGHITPSLQLAKKLVARGFRITFVNTTQNHDRLMQTRSKNEQTDNDIGFVSVSDGFPDDHPRLRDATAFLTGLLEMGPAFEELFIKLLHKSPITCVIRDIRFWAAQNAAKKLGIPVVAFASPSAIFTQCQFHLPTFVSSRILPLPPPPAHAPTPSLDARTMILGPPRSAEEAAARQAPLTCLPGGSPTMKVEDLPTPLLTHEPDTFWYRFYQISNPLLPECDCILFNTFHDLEGDVLDAMSDMNSNIFAVGPLILNSTTTADGVEEVAIAGAGSALLDEDHLCLSWLDARSPNSVLYVSFGSIATMSVEQMQEFACGLEISGHAFIWVVRSDLIDDMCENKEFERIFSEFVERTKDRALLVSWAPQTAVLSHPSVAAFLTHCGWNSIIESVSSGVPMLGWPQFYDQNTNCRYITHVWKIGLRFESQVRDGSAVVPKEEVALKVRQIMAPDGTNMEVDEIRSNSRNFQKAGREAVAKGGSSERALTTFVELVRKKAIHSSPPQHR
ncbi:hypothetical protein M758_11G103000 [Ceratodon purpureus]|nr:hypothetical protein M758_11G103000 [Ceratodon purpureus]